MSGIAGIFHVQTAKPVDEARVRAMLGVMVHRGPDGMGLWSAPGVGLGHMHLSVIDPAGGAQPMVTADGQIVVTCDGEIYNVASLRVELEALGHCFRTDSDTEVILHGWRQWGEACVDRFEGIFAFALHDSATHSLFLARDRFGVKPLHYATLADGSLIFASELKGLLVHPAMRRAPNLAAIEDYLAYGYVPDDTCVVNGVAKLRAGHVMRLVRGKPMPSPRPYWDISFAERTNAKPAAMEEELTALLRDAVRARMVADVPVGALLSGGVDSAAVVALMAEAGRSAVKTCTMGFDMPALDETPYAERIARRFGTAHHSRIVSAEDFSLIDRLADHFDEPFADASALPTYRAAALAREVMTVALSGDGADEVFAGHRRHLLQHREERTRAWFPSAIRRSMLGPLERLHPKVDLLARPLRMRERLLGLARDGADAYAEGSCITPAAVRATLWNDHGRAAFSGHRPEDRYVKAMANAPARSPIDRAQYADIKLRLPGSKLTRLDRMGAAAGLQIREPMLDHRLVEFAARLPVSMRLHGATGKYLLKKAMEPMLPADVLYRPQRDWEMPVSQWFRCGLANAARVVAGGSALARTDLFDMKLIARLAEQHRRGAADQGPLLWQLLMLDKAIERLFMTR